MSDKISPEDLERLMVRVSGLNKVMQSRSHIQETYSPTIDIAKVAGAKNGVHLLDSGYKVLESLKENLLKYKVISIDLSGVKRFNNEFMIAAFGLLHRYYDSETLRHAIMFSANSVLADTKDGFITLHSFTMANAYASIYYKLSEDQRANAPFSHILDKITEE